MPRDGYFKLLLEASWQGGLVIALILLLRPMLGVWVPARWRYALWTLVLVRLLVPASLLPPSPASLQNLPVVDGPLEHAVRAFDRTETTGTAFPSATQPRLLPQGPDEAEAPPIPTATHALR